MSEPAVQTSPTTRRVVELACRAPSVHNTQPWAWRIGPDRIDLYADWSRQLPVSDPEGRNLVISCGAALHHAQVAAAAFGLDTVVTRFPDPSSTRHLASLALAPAAYPHPDAAAELRALELRTTDRQRFTDWPIPDERLLKVAASITQDGVHGVALTDVADRFRVELLVSAALAVAGGRRGPGGRAAPLARPQQPGRHTRRGPSRTATGPPRTSGPASPSAARPRTRTTAGRWCGSVRTA